MIKITKLPTPGAWAERCVAGRHMPLGWWYEFGDLLDDSGPTSGSLDAPYLED